MVQLVTFPTHRNGHTLDLIITAADSSLSPKTSYSRLSPSDHFPVFSQLSIQPPPPSSLFTEISFRCVDAISVPHFVRYIFSSFYSHSSSPSSLSELVDCYNTTLNDILNKHMLLLKLNEFTLNHLIPGLFLNFVLALKTSCRCLQKSDLGSLSFGF